jgi:hypothetical protein
MVDKELHKSTQYRIPKLQEQIGKEKKRVCSFVLSCNEDGWDSYNAETITVDTIKLAAQALDVIYSWFEKNIGFLNNRTLDIWTAPNPDGNIHLEFNYDDMFEFDVYVKFGEEFDLDFHPMHRHRLDGTKTIADRDFKMVFPKDRMSHQCNIDGIHKFLDEAFYTHKWKFEEDNDG